MRPRNFFFQRMEEGPLNLSHLRIQDWSYLWTEYDYRCNPSLKTGDNFNNYLIQTYGCSFKYCLNKNSSRLLKKLFQDNLNAKEEVDCNCHPIRLAVGTPGIGKTQFLLEYINHLQENYPGLLGNLVDVIMISYNNGNLPSNIDKQLDAEKV
jgi:hypothetical protein